MKHFEMQDIASDIYDERRTSKAKDTLFKAKRLGIEDSIWALRHAQKIEQFWNIRHVLTAW